MYILTKCSALMYYDIQDASDDVVVNTKLQSNDNPDLNPKPNLKLILTLLLIYAWQLCVGYLIKKVVRVAVLLSIEPCSVAS